MKIYFLIISLLVNFGIARSAGESSGNPSNDCNTSSGLCDTTPTAFEMKVFQVGLCKSNPMSTSTEVFDFDNSECVYVYKNDDGQLTGDIFSDNKTSLDSTFVTVPNEGTYNYTFAIVSNVFKMATHHMVFNAGSDNSTNGKRYVSTSSGGSIEGNIGSEERYDVTVNTFQDGQLSCSNNNGYNSANSHSDTGVSGNGFIGRLTNDQLVLTKSGSGDISNNTAICDNVSRIISIMEGSVVIGSDSEGVNIKITSGKGTSRVNQGSGNGVVTGFSGKGKSFKYDVSTF